MQQHLCFTVSRRKIQWLGGWCNDLHLRLLGEDDGVGHQSTEIGAGDQGSPRIVGHRRAAGDQVGQFNAGDQVGQFNADLMLMAFVACCCCHCQRPRGNVYVPLQQFFCKARWARAAGAVLGLGGVGPAMGLHRSDAEAAPAVE